MSYFADKGTCSTLSTDGWSKSLTACPLASDCIFMTAHRITRNIFLCYNLKKIKKNRING